jgi:hypothetical protein
LELKRKKKDPFITEKKANQNTFFGLEMDSVSRSLTTPNQTNATWRHQRPEAVTWLKKELPKLNIFILAFT